MNKVNDTARSTPLEMYEKAAFELAMYDITMEKVQNIENTNDPVMDGGLESMYQKSLPKVRKMIRRASRLAKVKALLRLGAPKIMRVAACLLLATYVGMTAAVAVSGNVRARVAEFLIKVNDGYAELGYWSDETISIPAGWTASYFPAYIPEGYELADVDSAGTICTATYFLGNDCAAYLHFTVAKSSSRTNIDTDNAQLWYEQVNGANAMFIQREGITDVVWSSGDHYFIVTLKGMAGEAKKIAESTKLLE